MRPEMTSNAWALRRCTMPAQPRIANPRLVKDHRGGEEKAFHALVGQAMQACRGKNVRCLGLLERMLATSVAQSTRQS